MAASISVNASLRSPLASLARALILWSPAWLGLILMELSARKDAPSKSPLARTTLAFRQQMSGSSLSAFRARSTVLIAPLTSPASSRFSAMAQSAPTSSWTTAFTGSGSSTTGSGSGSGLGPMLPAAMRERSSFSLSDSGCRAMAPSRVETAPSLSPRDRRSLASLSEELSVSSMAMRALITPRASSRSPMETAASASMSMMRTLRGSMTAAVLR